MSKAPPSRAAALVAAVADRLAGITRTAGYYTDAGRHIWRGRTAIDADELPAITVFEDEDLVEEQRVTRSAGGEAIDTHVLLPLSIEASAHCDPDHPSLAAHELIADIKRALFSGDLTFGGLASHARYTGRTIQPREAGTAIVTAKVMIRLGCTEDLSAP